MSRLLFVLMTMVVMVSPSRGQEIPWANKFFQNPPPPVIGHDFGTTPKGTLLTHRFPITNIYAVPMQITDIRRSCGCVNAVASKQVLQPREQGSIDVTMDTRKFDGEKSVSIYVTLGPKYVSTAVLQVHAVSRADIMLKPGHVDFGVVAQGKQETRSIEVTYTSIYDWRITSVEDNAAPFEVRAQELVRKRGQISYRIFVTLKKNALAGSLNNEIILHTNDPSAPQLRIRTTGRVQPPLSVTPEVLNMGTVPANQATTKNVLVRAAKPFRILRVEGEGEGLTAKLPPVAAPVQIVTIRFEPTQSGTVRRQLRFITDIDENVTPTVTIEANVE